MCARLGIRLVLQPIEWEKKEDKVLLKSSCRIWRKEDIALRDKIQETIDEMNADGTLKEISEKWFGKNITIVK